MKNRVFIYLTLMCVSTFGHAQYADINTRQLGALEQRTQSVQAVNAYQGAELMASVSEISGQAFLLDAPMNVQRAVYIKAQGEKVQAGEPFVTLFGPEVHHYYSQYLISQALYQQARLLFENSQKLFNTKSISEAEWLQVSQSFYALRLEYDEYSHFFEYLHAVDETQDSLTIAAPVSGIVAYTLTSRINMHDPLARFIPEGALRLKINVPVNNSLSLSAVQAFGCTLSVEQVGKQVEGFATIAWSQALPPECSANIGETLSVRPSYRVNALQVPSSSVFVLDGNNYVLLKQADVYRATKVTLLSGQQNTYVVTSNSLSQGDEVLVSSVSAAQGIMMGLGE